MLAVPANVADRDAVAALADAAFGEMGRVDVLCSNAGVGVFPAIAEATASDWDWVLSVNLGGMVNCLLAFLPRMAAQDGEKHIVLTASIAGLASFGMTIYSTTKYAIVGMGESLAQESEANGYGIGVSILCPGGVDTKFGTSDRNRPDGQAGGQVSPIGTSRGSDPDRHTDNDEPRRRRHLRPRRDRRRRPLHRAAPLHAGARGSALRASGAAYDKAATDS